MVFQTTFKANTQYLLNWLQDLLLSDEDLQDLGWTDITNVDILTRNPPSGAIVPFRKSQEEQGFDHLYEYNLVVLVTIVNTRSENTDENQLYFYEQKVEDLIAINDQVVTTTDIGDAFTIRADVKESSYGQVYSDTLVAYDVVEMEIHIKYSRRIK